MDKIHATQYSLQYKIKIHKDRLMLQMGSADSSSTCHVNTEQQKAYANTDQVMCFRRQ